MDPNLSITSIEFKCKDYRDASLSYVKLNYSDGQTVEFENTIPQAYAQHETFHFDANVPITAVSASQKGPGEVYGIAFQAQDD